MPEQDITLDQRAQARLEVVRRVERKELRRKEAAQLLNVGARQFREILKRYREEGPAGPASRRHGRAPGNKFPDETRRAVLALLRRQEYRSLGPRRMSERRAERHGRHVSRETLRQWMTEDGLWMPQPRGARPERPPRETRK